MKTPWHLWIIGGGTLLWNAGGLYDFVMMQTQNEAYLAKLPDMQRDFFFQFPVWAHLTWAIGVLGAVTGSLLLLFRSRFAVVIFALSLIGMLLTTMHNLLIANPSAFELMGTGALFFSGLIFIIAIGLVLYARSMKAKGILK